jgi:hypothetical protein
VKAHQSRVIDAITVPQSIPINLRLSPFAVKPQLRHDLLSGGLLTIGGVGEVMNAAGHLGDHSVFAVAGQQ